MDLKQRIIENASALFFRNGIKSITMSDIAAELGISKRTLYEIFCDKDELLEQCMLAHMKHNDCKLASFIETSDNVIDTLLQFHSMQLSSMWSVARSAVRDLRKYHHKIYDRFQECHHEKISGFIPFFEKGVKQGLIRDDIPFEILLFVLKRQFKTLMEDENLPDKYPFNDYIRAMTLTFIRGIATPLGNEHIDKIINNK
jgi:AcrR family transcriptional regulator